MAKFKGVISIEEKDDETHSWATYIVRVALPKTWDDRARLDRVHVLLDNTLETHGVAVYPMADDMADIHVINGLASLKAKPGASPKLLRTISEHRALVARKKLDRIVTKLEEQLEAAATALYKV